MGKFLQKTLILAILIVSTLCFSSCSLNAEAKLKKSLRTSITISFLLTISGRNLSSTELITISRRSHTTFSKRKPPTGRFSRARTLSGNTYTFSILIPRAIRFCRAAKTIGNGTSRCSKQTLKRRKPPFFMILRT